MQTRSELEVRSREAEVAVLRAELAAANQAKAQVGADIEQIQIRLHACRPAMGPCGWVGAEIEHMAFLMGFEHDFHGNAGWGRRGRLCCAPALRRVTCPLC